MELSDASCVLRDGRWWLFLVGQPGGAGSTDLFSASLPVGASVQATGWALARGAGDHLIPLAGRESSYAWDGKGGRHCPSYARGWDPSQRQWVERLYYAGAAEHLWGPYTIGCLEWDGGKWVDQAQPVFKAEEPWEHGSVYEPNLIYHEGKWRLWYVAGSNYEDYLVHGYAESEDGRTGWTKHAIFAPPEMKLFDFCVRPFRGGFASVYSRVAMKAEPPPETGLWWCQSDRPSGRFADWANHKQLMTAENRGWHAGPWKPSLAIDDAKPVQACIFFDGLYPANRPGPFPFTFTLGCLELNLLSAAEAS